MLYPNVMGSCLGSSFLLQVCSNLGWAAPGPLVPTGCSPTSPGRDLRWCLQGQAGEVASSLSPTRQFSPSLGTQGWDPEGVSGSTEAQLFCGRSQEHWYTSYIDLLQRFQLWNISNEVIKLSTCRAINCLNQASTTLHVNCSNCKRPMSNRGWICDR